MTSVLNKSIVLVLNALWIPIGHVKVRQAIVAMNSSSDGMSVAAKGIDMSFEQNGDGNIDYINPVYIRDVSWEEWIALPVRDYDDIIHGVRFNIRAPTVILAVNYKSMHMRKLRPTKTRILARDGYRCQYTGKILPPSQLNVDHILPRSRGGKDSWENMVAAWKKINFTKGDKTPEEAGLRLLNKPKAPAPVSAASLMTEVRHPTWLPFIIHKK